MKFVGIAHSKHRNAIGLIGIQVIPKENQVRVKFARQWLREDLSTTPGDIASLYRKYKWDKTFIDQKVGQFFIKELRGENVPLKVINTQKDLKDPHEIEHVRIMDIIEMTHFMITLKQNHQVEFPPKPPKSVQELEKQMGLFTEHKTEAGGLNYFASGKALDSLTKALMISCFAARRWLIIKNNSPRMMVSVTMRRSSEDELGSGLTGTQMSKGKSTHWPGGGGSSRGKSRYGDRGYSIK